MTKVGPLMLITEPGLRESSSLSVTTTVFFNYPEGVHNVLKVNGTGFQECAAPAGTVVLTSGKDVINLATTGRKWYICGVSKHRQVGPQKLFITVMPASFAPRS
ncbi:putative cupredoxin [Rosa chinensis]|uniref:Putative cupredoxin n=1 Tax=Rosa chinensis TaxID=74649 RepID=A0A2P6S115_ROSCH|nr:putative cupredoxin [Rosa chinensis]